MENYDGENTELARLNAEVLQDSDSYKAWSVSPQLEVALSLAALRNHPFAH